MAAPPIRIPPACTLATRTSRCASSMHPLRSSPPMQRCNLQQRISPHVAWPPRAMRTLASATVAYGTLRRVSSPTPLPLPSCADLAASCNLAKVCPSVRSCMLLTCCQSLTMHSSLTSSLSAVLLHQLAGALLHPVILPVLVPLLQLALCNQEAPPQLLLPGVVLEEPLVCSSVCNPEQLAGPEPHTGAIQDRSDGTEPATAPPPTLVQTMSPECGQTRRIIGPSWQHSAELRPTSANMARFRCLHHAECGVGTIVSPEFELSNTASVHQLVVAPHGCAVAVALVTRVRAEGGRRRIAEEQLPAGLGDGLQARGGSGRRG